jgi:hypothetical protein
MEDIAAQYPFSQYFRLFAYFRNPKLSVGSGQSVVFSHHTDGTFFISHTESTESTEIIYFSNTDGTDGTDGGYCGAISFL